MRITDTGPGPTWSTSAFVVACALGLLLTGCAIWPSSWRFGKTPLEKAAAKQQTADEASSALVKRGQRSAHQAAEVLAFAPSSQPVTIARDLLADATASLDQAVGAPAAAEAAAWRDFAARLVSDNLATRVKAVDELAAQRRDTAAASVRAQRALADAWRAKQQALAYAADREDLADFAAKLKLGFFGLIGLLVLGTVLSIVAKFVPAFGLASRVVNGVVATGITYAAHRAETGLQRVGGVVAQVRQKLGDQAEAFIEQHFDTAVTDPDHRQLIAAGAAAAGAPPPAA